MSLRVHSRRALGAIRHPISQNAGALYAMQLATFVAPLVTLPYVSRTLGPGEYGLVLYAQGFSFLLGALLDYGFAASGARDASLARGDRDELARILSRVLGAKMLLIVAATAISLVAFALIAKLREHPEYLVLAWLTAVAQGLTPLWFFIGIERPRLVAAITLVARLVPAALTFALVTGADDGWILLALYAAAGVCSAAVVNVLAYRRAERRRPVGARSAIGELRRTWVIFAAIGGVTLYTSANIVILGFFATSVEVASFGAADRLVRATLQLVGPVAAVVFPRLVFLHASGDHARARRLARISIGVLGGAGLLMAAFIAASADPIVSVVYGDGYEGAVPVLRILSMLVPLVAVTTTLALGWMVSLNMDRAVARIAICVGVLNVALALVLAPAWGPEGMACSVVVAEVVALVACLAAIRGSARRVPAASLFSRRDLLLTSANRLRP